MKQVKSWDSVVKIAYEYKDLTGQGEEWLLAKDESVVAVFYDGNLVPTSRFKGNSETTLVPSKDIKEHMFLFCIGVVYLFIALYALSNAFHF